MKQNYKHKESWNDIKADLVTLLLKNISVYENKKQKTKRKKKVPARYTLRGTHSSYNCKGHLHSFYTLTRTCDHGCVRKVQSRCILTFQKCVFYFIYLFFIKKDGIQGDTSMPTAVKWDQLTCTVQESFKCFKAVQQQSHTYLGEHEMWPPTKVSLLKSLAVQCS